MRHRTSLHPVWHRKVFRRKQDSIPRGSLSTLPTSHFLSPHSPRRWWRHCWSTWTVTVRWQSCHSRRRQGWQWFLLARIWKGDNHWGCTSDGVYVPCTDAHTTWELPSERVTTFEDVPLVEFMSLVFTHMPVESYRRWLRSLLLSLCYVFWVLINSLVWWFWKGDSWPFWNDIRDAKECVCVCRGGGQQGLSRATTLSGHCPPPRHQALCYSFFLQKPTRDISLLRIFQLSHIVLHSYQSVQCACACMCVCMCVYVHL